MKKYDIVVWDVDGTLLDTREGVLSSVRYAIENEKLTMPDESILETYIGPPIQETFQKQYSLSMKKAEEMAAVFRERYKDKDLYKAKVYEGIETVFSRLIKNDIKIAVATYKREDYAKRIVEYFGLSKYASVVCGSDFDGKMRKKDIIKKCLDILNCQKEERVLMIGDSDNDAKGAELLGIDFLGVTYGYGFKTREDVDKYKNIGCVNSAMQIVGLIFEEDKEYE